MGRTHIQDSMGMVLPLGLVPVASMLALCDALRMYGYEHSAKCTRERRRLYLGSVDLGRCHSEFIYVRTHLP